MLINKNNWKFFTSLVIFLVLGGVLLVWHFVLSSTSGQVNMAAMLNFGNNPNYRIIGLPDPRPGYDGDAINKKYADRNILRVLPSDPSDAVVGEMWILSQ